MKTAVEWLQDCLTEQYPNGSFVWNTKADLEALFNQAKKMENQQCYSEEEVIHLLKALQLYKLVHTERIDIEKWLEKFKNK